MDTSSLVYMYMHLPHPKNEKGARNVGMSIVPKPKRQRQEDYMSSRPVWSTWQNHSLEKQKKREHREGGGRRTRRRIRSTRPSSFPT